MSTGLLVCTVCSREVHQDGPREHSLGRCRCPLNTGFCRATWLHCEDKSPLCVGATTAYPKTRAVIVGAYCGADE